jgi:hypothetical protein
MKTIKRITKRQAALKAIENMISYNGNLQKTKQLLHKSLSHREVKQAAKQYLHQCGE